MTDKIEVIDINDNNSDAIVETPTETSPDNIVQPVEEVKQKEVKPNAKSKPRAKAKAKANYKEEVKQDEIKQEEVNQEEVKQEEVKQEEVKPKSEMGLAGFRLENHNFLDC